MLLDDRLENSGRVFADRRLPSPIRRKGDRPDHIVLGEGKALGKRQDRANQQMKKDREEKTSRCAARHDDLTNAGRLSSFR